MEQQVAPAGKTRSPSSIVAEVSAD